MEEGVEPLYGEYSARDDEKASPGGKSESKSEDKASAERDTADLLSSAVW